MGLQTEGWPEHWYPDSTVQVAEHPFPEVVPASSHPSLSVIIPSPQISTQVDADVGVPPEHDHPGAFPEQSPLHLLVSI